MQLDWFQLFDELKRGAISAAMRNWPIVWDLRARKFPHGAKTKTISEH
jgi:hypothetical protein